MPDSTNSAMTLLGDRRGERDPQQRKQGAALLHTLRHANVGGWSDDKWEQVRHFTGVPFVAIKAVMDLVSGATFQVVKRKKKHSRNRTTFGANGTVTKALPTAHAHARDDEYTPFDDLGHPLAKLADYPNPVETFGELATNLVLQNRLTGVAPLWAVPNASGKPVELWALKTPTTTPLYQQSLLYPNGAWRVQPYTNGGGLWSSSHAGAVFGSAGAVLPGDEVKRWLEPHPFMELDGFSPLSATAKQLDVLEAIDDSRHASMENGVSLNAVLIAPGMDPADLDRVVAKVNERQAGARNAGRFFALAPPAGQGPTDKTTLTSISGQSAKDMDYQQGWEQMTKFCLAVFGVPASVAGLAGATSYSELYAALRQFHHRQSAFVHRLADWLTKIVCRPYWEFPGQYRFQIDLPTLDDPDLMERQLGTDIPNGLVTWNEARALRNRPTTGPDGDVPIPIYLKLLEANLTPRPDPQAAPGGAPAPADPAQPEAAAPGAPAPTGGATPPDAQPAPDAPETPPDGAQAANAPAGDVDPLAALLGTEAQPGGEEQAGAESAQPEEGDETEGAVVKAALAALGIPDDAVTKAFPLAVNKPGKAPKHTEGQKFQSNGKWFKISGGRAVPTTPDGAQAGKPQASGAKPTGKPQAAAPQPKLTDARHNPDLDDVFAAPATAPKPVPTGDPRHNPDLDDVFGESKPQAAKPAPPPVPKVAPASEPGYDTKPVAVPTRAEFHARLPEAAKTVVASTPQAKATLSKVDAWAGKHADKHADRVAAHFGVSREKAHALLVSAIRAVAHHASEYGVNATATIRDPRTGKTATLTPGKPGAKPVARKAPLPPDPVEEFDFDDDKPAIPKPTPAPAKQAPRAAPAAANWEEIAGSAKPVSASAPAKRGLLGRGLDHAMKYLGTPAEKRLARSRIAKRTPGSTPTGGAVPKPVNRAAKGTGVPRVKKAVGGGLVFKGEWSEDKHARDHGKFASKPGSEGSERADAPKEGTPIGKGSTGEVTRHGDEVHKNATRDEGKVYAALAGVHGIASGRLEGDKIVTPHFAHVLSVDTVPLGKRASYASIIAKQLPALVNAVTALSEAGYDYDDPIQVGFDKGGKTAHLFDFSAAQKTGVESATEENLSRLSSYLEAFGATRPAAALSQINGVLRYMKNDDAREFDDEAAETKDAERVLAQLDGKPAKYAYYSFNARTIPTVPQTEHRDGIKAVFTSEPLSEEFMKQWELNPAIHRTDATREQHKAIAPDTDFVDPAPFGFCPECRAPGVGCERRPNGNAHCANGHTYPRDKAKYASTQVELTGEAKRKLLALGEQIASEDLCEDEGGLESDAHVTCLYGLHVTDAAPVADVVRDFGPVALRLGSLRAFRGADSGKPYDVLYCEVDSPGLHRLRTTLEQLPHTKTHSYYVAHATIGYLTAGAADKYLRELPPVNEDFVADALTFSTAAREHTSVPLTDGALTKSLPSLLAALADARGPDFAAAVLEDAKALAPEAFAL